MMVICSYFSALQQSLELVTKFSLIKITLYSWNEISGCRFYTVSAVVLRMTIYIL